MTGAHNTRVAFRVGVLTFTVWAEGEPVFAEDHIHPLAVPADEKCTFGLPRVTAADPQDLLGI